MTLAGFESTTLTHEGKTRTVYRAGTGPAVLVMHEMPGITPPVAAFARRVAGAGFSVYMPELFGDTGRPFTYGYNARELLRACIRDEFHVWACNRSSPITDWLRALCRHAHAEQGGPGVGAIGMCITGNFALSLMVDDALMAPVLSQPSLPFAAGKKRKAALAISDDELSLIKRRCKVDPDLKVIGLRFTTDPMCPPERFETLRRELGDSFEGWEIDAKHANPDGPCVPHSVVTNHLIDREGEPTRKALDRVLGYFDERLKLGRA